MSPALSKLACQNRIHRLSLQPEPLQWSLPGKQQHCPLWLTETWQSALASNRSHGIILSFSWGPQNPLHPSAWGNTAIVWSYTCSGTYLPLAKTSPLASRNFLDPKRYSSFPEPLQPAWPPSLWRMWVSKLHETVFLQSSWMQHEGCWGHRAGGFKTCQ